MREEQLIHDATMEILRDVGIKVRNTRAIAVLKDNGIRVDGEIAFFTEEQVMSRVKMAPASFTLHARNPAHSMELGGDRVYPSPAYGCAFMADRDGRQRPGAMADYANCPKLVQANEDFSICGGIIIQPADVPEATAPIDMFYASLLHSDKAIFLSTGTGPVMESLMKAGCTLFGGERGMIEKPGMITLINTNSPLSLDTQMLDCLMVFARYGQPVIVSPAAMLGTTSPITFAGTLASGNAENLAGIALAQMIRPGTPVVYGIQSTGLDMRNAQYACAAPEGTIMQGFGARMARFYGMPSRGGGSLTDAPLVNAQAGYESMMCYYSAHRHGINLVTQAGGVVGGVKTTSYDKMLCDFEIIRMVRRCFDPVVVNEETLNLSDIREVAHDGEFLTSEHTLEHCRELYTPQLGTRGDTDPAYLERNMNREYARLMEVFENRRPVLDQGLRNEIRHVLQENADVDARRFEKIEALLPA